MIHLCGAKFFLLPLLVELCIPCFNAFWKYTSHNVYVVCLPLVNTTNESSMCVVRHILFYTHLIRICVSQSLSSYFGHLLPRFCVMSGHVNPGMTSSFSSQ